LSLLERHFCDEGENENEHEPVPCEEKYLHNSFKGLTGAGGKSNELLAFNIPPGRIWLQESERDFSLPLIQLIRPVETGETPPQKTNTLNRQKFNVLNH